MSQFLYKESKNSVDDMNPMNENRDKKYKALLNYGNHQIIYQLKI